MTKTYKNVVRSIQINEMKNDMSSKIPLSDNSRELTPCQSVGVLKKKEKIRHSTRTEKEIRPAIHKLIRQV